VGCVLRLRDRHSTLNSGSACNVLRARMHLAAASTHTEMPALLRVVSSMTLWTHTDIEAISFDVMQGQPTSLTALAPSMITDPGDVDRVRHSVWLGRGDGER
jgi:hypothetical protein